MPDDGSSPLTGPVVDLSTADQQVLCERFVATLCSKPGFDSFCNACVTSNGCAMAATAGTIESNCVAPYTVEMVDECAVSGENEVCVQGGGCMIDALENVCHRVDCPEAGQRCLHVERL